MKKIFKPIIILLALLSLIKINYAYGSDSLYQYSPALFKGGEKALSLMIEQRVSFKDKSYKHIEHGNCNLLFKLSAKGSIDNITYFDLPDSCFFAESIALWLYNDCISWQPALFNNKPIDINVILKIEFSFDQHSKYIKVESSYFSQPDKSLENSLYNEDVKLQLEDRKSTRLNSSHRT